MEELQSTEVLDREILEDARKKAFRILKSADDTVRANTASWDRKMEERLAELDRRYRERRERAAAGIMARLPLDKRRIKSGKMEALLGAAAAAWYGGLKRSQVLAILEDELAKRLEACPEFAGDGACRAVLRHVEREEAAALIGRVLPGLEYAVEAEREGNDPYPGMTLVSSSIRIIASIGMVIDVLLHEKRAELLRALIGEEPQ
ncbi:MAG: ATPase [Treponema sp.]|jgi:vacuolar-type H+-ATPase subunit E/Vma4|nr:ATPase [Treponema sp.]